MVLIVNIMYISFSEVGAMEIKYDKSFFTRISEYQVQVEVNRKGLHKVSIQRFTADKETDHPSEYLNIHPDILLDLIRALEECGDIIGINPRPAEGKISTDKIQEIQKRYLRGVSVKDLSVQFDRKETFIENVLLESGIKLVSPKSSMPYKMYPNYRRTRF